MRDSPSIASLDELQTYFDENIFILRLATRLLCGFITDNQEHVNEILISELACEEVLIKGNIRNWLSLSRNLICFRNFLSEKSCRRIKLR